ncbi:reductase with NAD or NADP as acceptor [Thraustotheca clavata]|uniref:Reductase with NAD or NADP as acceptor n=1 Tax=Thraustotheca clavata TaxID=74557 RepID=A0A1V9ZC87_9STRA|nr:reductase with NAD or NADP as acceptor [Thraustotheca clavata]
MALWATFFLEGWKRTSSIYALQWGTSNHHDTEQPRPQFKGTDAISAINGSKIQYFDDNERLKRRVVSWLVLFLMIALVLSLTAGIFFLRYYITLDKEKDKFVVDVHGHKVPFGSIVVSLINLVQIYIMYRIYDPLSLRMNDYENHATESSYEANYILKAIIFHFVNSYSALIYVASLKSRIGDRCANDNCFDELRYCLIIIYGSQIVIGNTKEVLVPRFWAWLKRRNFNASETKVSPAEEQFFKSHYGWKGTFDDYLEMIIQFGYSTFFVISFPLTPLLSFINNIIEIRIDGFRLRDDCRRPRPRIAANIGLWIEVLETFVTIAIITNGWVIFYTYEYASVLKNYMTAHGTTADFDVSYLELGLFVAFVTVVLGIRAIIAKFINDVPTFVRRQLSRQEFLTSKILDRVKEDNDKEYTVEDRRLATNIHIAPFDDEKREKHGHSMVVGPSPFLSPLQRKAAEKSYPPVPKVCVVTGGTGFVGQRVVEMLVERGASKVISFDIVPKPVEGFWEHENIEYVVGDIADRDAVFNVCKGADCVWHLAAAVGPFHPKELYYRVNYQGTINVIDACKEYNVPKIVMSSSPSTRFDGSDIDGLKEEDMPKLPQDSYLQAYAETKAMGEIEMLKANSPTLMTVAIAPHQVYGPRDNLFMPNILEAGGNGLLRIFATGRTGYGYNKVCFTHVDNYAHGLIIGERALVPNGPATGKFYIVTDGATHPSPAGYAYFWKVVDNSVTAMGFPSLWDKYKLPSWFLWPVAYLSSTISFFTGRSLKLNPFTVRVLTMHRWFDISAAMEDLQFEPIISFDEGWNEMNDWFRLNWLPKFQKSHGLAGIAAQSQAKIDVQATTISS